MENWYSIVYNLAQWSSCIPLILGIIRFKKLSPRQLLLLLLLAIAIVLQFVGDLLREAIDNNTPAFHLYILSECVLIFFIYRKELARLFPKFLLPSFVIAFGGLSIAEATFLSGIMQVPTYARTTEGILIILLGFSYFALIYREMRIVRMERHFLFWFTFANLMYFSFNLLLFFSSNFLNQKYLELSLLLYQYHAITVFILNGLYAVAITRTDPVEG